MGAAADDPLDDLIAWIQRRRTSDSAELELLSLEREYLKANVFDE